MDAQVTVAITVYRRDRFLAAAVESALAQTMPVRVLVVDDAAPGVDHAALLRPFVARGVVHVRNPQTLGLVGNFNRCLQLAETPWVSVCHDDDELLPDAIERLLAAAAAKPGRGLYFGCEINIDEEGGVTRREPADGVVRDMPPEEFVFTTNFSFPGQLLDRAAALAAGGFEPRLTMTSDWELWMRLAIARGAVKTGHHVTLARQYWSEGRATTALERRGYRLFSFVQQYRRNFAHLRRAGLPAPDPARLRQRAAEEAQGALAAHAGQLTPRARRLYRLYARLAPPSNAPFKQALFRLSPVAYSWLITGYGIWKSRRRVRRDAK